MHGPGDGRQRARRCLGRHGGLDWLAQQTCAQRSGVAIEDHAARRQHLARGQAHTADAPALQLNTLGGAAIPKDHAARRRQPRQALRQRMHAALHRPHAVEFNLRDQHQRGWCLPGRRAAVGGVARKQLAHARVLEVRAQAVPQAAQRADLGQHTQAAQAQPAGHLHEGRYGRSDERALKRRVHLAGCLAKDLKAPGFCSTGKGFDGFVRAGSVGKQVQAAAVFPEVARQHRQLVDF